MGQGRDGVESQNDLSLQGVKRALGHEGIRIDILKVDIEGSEFEVLKSYIGPGCPLQANMLLIETHADSNVNYNSMFQQLRDNCHMELFYKEANIMLDHSNSRYSDGRVLEWCWVHVDWKAIPAVEEDKKT